MPRTKMSATDEATGSQESSSTAATGNGRTKGRRVNKMECMRQALARLGYDAKPKQLQKFLWSNFRVKMSTKMISTYKGSLTKQAGQASGIMRTAQADQGQPARLKQPSAGGGLGVDDVRAVKQLADHLGAERVRELLDVLYQ